MRTSTAMTGRPPGLICPRSRWWRPRSGSGTPGVNARAPAGADIARSARPALDGATRARPSRWRARAAEAGRGSPPHRLAVLHPQRYLAHLAVADAEAPQHGSVLVGQGEDQVGGVRVGGQLHVGARRVGLGEGVRVEDPDQVPAALVHLGHGAELRLRLDHVEGRAGLGVGQGEGLLDPATVVGRPGEQRARLVGIFLPGMGDQRLVGLPVDLQHPVPSSVGRPLRAATTTTAPAVPAAGTALVTSVASAATAELSGADPLTGGLPLGPAWPPATRAPASLSRPPGPPVHRGATARPCVATRHPGSGLALEPPGPPAQSGGRRRTRSEPARPARTRPTRAGSTPRPRRSATSPASAAPGTASSSPPEVWASCSSVATTGGRPASSSTCSRSAASLFRVPPLMWPAAASSAAPGRNGTLAAWTSPATPLARSMRCRWPSSP